MREALAPAERWRYVRERPGLLELVLERDPPLLLRRVEEWEASGELECELRSRPDPERGSRAWRTLRRASLIASPLKSAAGRTLGALLLVSQEGSRQLGEPDLRAAQVLSDLSGLVLERADLLEEETRRARTEARLKRASEAVAGSLELDEVYRRVAEQGMAVTGARKAVLTPSRTRPIRP